MNKKKKATRLKHRKNKERMKNIISVSRLKAKPKKKVDAPKEVESAVQATEEIKKPTVAKKTPAKKAAAKKTAK